MLQNINKAFVPKKGFLNKDRWKVIDAKGKIIGRLASHIAYIARGKDEPTFTPHAKTGYRIVVINAAEAVFSGKKMSQKIYWKYTRYIGNKQEFTAEEKKKTDPIFLLKKAIKGMLRNSPLTRDIFKNNILIYPGSSHPHGIQTGTDSK